MKTSVADDAKERAIHQWTNDPCGPDVGGAMPGSREYFEALMDARHEHAPWIAEQLDYEHCRGLRVLDVGCGQGIDIARYAMAGAVVTGIDLTPRHVELATDHVHAIGLDCEVFRADAEALPFLDDTFDRISSNGVLHHTPDMSAALREIKRVLRSAGEARIIVYNKTSFHYWIEQVLSQGILHGKLLREGSMAGVLSASVERTSVNARPLVRVYTPRQLRAMLQAAGYTDVMVAVRHFNVEDTFITGRLHRRVAKLGDSGLRDRIGRIGGWYIIGRGRKP